MKTMNVITTPRPLLARIIRRALWAVLGGSALITGHLAGAAEFAYKYKTGDRYRIVSTVNEDIYVDRKLSYQAEILTRITMEITAVNGERARHRATFQSAEKTAAVAAQAAAGGAKTTAAAGAKAAAPFQWARDYQAEYDQDRLGRMTIDPRYYMPMVRNVPVFPGRNLNAGETWTSEGIEVHDFRDSYGIEEPYRIPFTAHYTYLGERTWKGAVYPAFSISYRVFLEPPEAAGKTFPRRILDASDQIVYWDMERGQAAAYEEHFRTIIDLSDGQTWEYRGRAEAEVVEAPPMNKEAIAQEIAGTISEIPDASVRVSNEGIVISLENIQFAPDSAILRPGERPKLDKIAEILMKYPDRDILVGGHTALAGTAAGRQQLSEERAATVAAYFMDKKVRTPGQVVIRGYGAEQPVADNRTEAGMRKNRRVEITILEN
jgi:outer membrane protein OmpA-like peptidoglycan-associated protein